MGFSSNCDGTLLASKIIVEITRERRTLSDLCSDSGVVSIGNRVGKVPFWGQIFYLDVPNLGPIGFREAHIP